MRWHLLIIALGFSVLVSDQMKPASGTHQS